LVQISAILGLLSIMFLIGNIAWSLFADDSKLNKNNNNSILGAEKFQRIIIGSKPKKKESLFAKIKTKIAKLTAKNEA
jgi:hypothetical protein